MLFHLKEWLISKASEEKNQLILFVPVLIGWGIYFSSYFKETYVIGAFIALIMLLFYLNERMFKNFILQVFSMMLALILLGAVAMMAKEAQIKTPLIKEETVKPIWIEGTVKDLQEGDRQKKVLFQVKRIHKQEISHLNLSLIYKYKEEKPFEIGDKILLKAQLSPLKGPITPDGYDFKRQALFKNIGGEGYITYIRSIAKQKASSLHLYLQRIRTKLHQKIQKKFPSQVGAFLSAIITGDTSNIKKETRENFVNSGTAHILAISGLHLTLVGGIIFFFFRYAASPLIFIVKHVPLQKIGMVFALFGTFFYFHISGGRIPTLRAFIGFSLVMVARLMDRSPISLRLVSFAATIVLLLYPESLETPSFQLSFAAVTALVALYELGQKYFLTPKNHILVYFCSLFVSSFIASLATLPFTAYHFSKISLQSIGTNMLAIPLLGFIILPILICWIALMWHPLISGPFACVLTKSTSLLFSIVNFFSGLSGAEIFITTLSAGHMLLITMGGLILCLLKTKLRFFGIFLMGIGTLLSALEGKRRPSFIITNHGKNIAFSQDQSLFHNGQRKKSFTTDVWGPYFDARPAKRYRFIDKHKPIPPYIVKQERNFVILKGAFKVFYERALEENPSMDRDLWISLVRHEKPGGYKGLFLGKEELKTNQFIYSDGKSLSK